MVHNIQGEAVMYNPFDLVSMTINKKPIYGRPVELDSEITDHKNMKNAFGVIVKPSKLSTTCPDCGQGLILDVVLSDPPFSYDTNCMICKPKVDIPPVFSNPVESNRVSEQDLDASLVDARQHIEVSTTVEERLEKKAKKAKKKVKAKKKDKEKEKRQEVEDLADKNQIEVVTAVEKKEESVAEKDHEIDDNIETPDHIENEVRDVQSVIEDSNEEFSLEEFLSDQESDEPECFDDDDMVES